MTTTFNSGTGNKSGDLIKELTEELKKLNRHLEQQLRNQPQFQSANSPQGTTVPTACLLYTSPSPRDRQKSRMPSSA